MRLKQLIQKEMHCYNIAKLIFMMGYLILPRRFTPKTSQMKYCTLVHETTKKS